MFTTATWQRATLGCLLTSLLFFQTASAISTGRKVPPMKNYDRLLSEFLKTHRTPGVAVAVTDQGRLVFARGYGYADIAAHTPVTPQSLFRIASLSKPITAVAILQLAEQNRLSLDDKVFQILDQYQPHFENGAKFDPRQNEITIRQLLQHRGGWDRSVSFDAMFQPVRFAQALGAQPPAGQNEIIRCMLGLPLDFAPGERYAYSNYGYCLLGRVIEKLTGQTYEEYTQQHVLAPLGIHDMRIGKSRLAGRQPNEVRYYGSGSGRSVFADDLGEKVPWPYGGWHLEAMDSHGGWIASAVDLARFAAAFDDPAHCPLLSEASIQEMFARPTETAGARKDKPGNEMYYSLGWMNRPAGGGKVNHWHTGSLDGTATLMVRRHDGRNWVVLLNSRVSPQSGHLGRAIDSLMHQAADQVEQWPSGDLFDEIGK